MAYQVTMDLTFSATRSEPETISGLATTGLISASAEKMNEEGTVWRITRIWDSAESANTYIAAANTARAGMESKPTVSNVTRTEI
mgnify:CR=1 FL=1|tara:strand:- start:303 stop:557 length:255 start_codon:yes stop_codon:yes gene_type:complete